MTDPREAIKAEMERQGVTTAALAESLGVARPTVAKMLSPRSDPRWSSLARMCRSLGLEVRVERPLPHGRGS